MVKAIRFVPEDQLFPKQDSIIYHLYGQIPFPSSRYGVTTLLDSLETTYFSSKERTATTSVSSTHLPFLPSTEPFSMSRYGQSSLSTF